MGSLGFRTLGSAVLAVSAVALAAPAQAITITTFTSRAAWTTAVNAVIPPGATILDEDFDDGDFDGGSVFSEAVADGYPGGFINNQWEDLVDANKPGGGTYQTNWNFNYATVAWGAEWNLAGSGQGINILLVFDGSTVGVLPYNPTISTGTTGFFGVLSDVPFTGVIVLADGQLGAQQPYTMDDMAYVPEPSGLLLLGLGFGTLALLRKRRRDN